MTPFYHPSEAEGKAEPSAKPRLLERLGNGGAQPWKPPQPAAPKTALWGVCAARVSTANEGGKKHMHHNGHLGANGGLLVVTRGARW